MITKSAPLDTELTFIVVYDEMSVEGTFEAGANAPNNVTVTFDSFDDEIALEPDELLSARLFLAEPHAQIMIPRPTVNVTIIDNEGE